MTAFSEIETILLDRHATRWHILRSSPDLKRVEAVRDTVSESSLKLAGVRRGRKTVLPHRDAQIDPAPGLDDSVRRSRHSIHVHPCPGLTQASRSD